MGSVKIRALFIAAALSCLALFGGTAGADSAPGPGVSPAVTAEPGQFLILPVGMPLPAESLRPRRDLLCHWLVIGHPAPWSALDDALSAPLDPPRDGGDGGQGWSWVVSPPLTTGGGRGEEPFHFFSLRPPAAAAPGTYRLVARLYATPTKPGYDRLPGEPAPGEVRPCPPPGPETPVLREARIPVTVVPVVRVEGEPLAPLDGLPGSRLRLPITLHNRGNVPVLVRVNPRLPAKWKAEAVGGAAAGRDGPEVHVPLGSHRSATVPLELAVPEAAPAGSYPVLVRVAVTTEPGGGGVTKPKETPETSLSLRTAVRVLPPPPGHIPRLAGRLPAAIRTRFQYSPGPSPQPAASALRARYGLSAALPGATSASPEDGPGSGSPSPAAPGGGWIRISGDTRRAEGGMALDHLDYRHPRGWRLRKTNGDRDAGELLGLPGETLQWDGGRWTIRAALPSSHARASSAPPPPAVPPASLSLHLGDGPLPPVSVGYRLGAPGIPPSAGIRLQWPLAEQGTAYVEGATASGPVAWGGGVEWSSAPRPPETSGSRDTPGEGGQPADQARVGGPVWTAAGRWSLRPPGFQGPAARAEGRLSLTRWSDTFHAGVRIRHGATEELLPADSFGLPLPYRAAASSFHGYAGRRLGRILGYPVDGELRAGRTVIRVGTPGAATEEKLDEVGWSLRLGGSGSRLFWRASRTRGAWDGWSHAVTWRRTGRGHWWQWLVGRTDHTSSAPPAPGSEEPHHRFHGWRLGAAAGWRSPGGWRWSGRVDWPLLREEDRSPVTWSLSMAPPASRAWDWRIDVAGGSGWRVDVSLVRRFHLPSPFPGGTLGQLEGKLVGPTGADLAGAVLELEGERVSTDSRGTFRFRPRPPGLYVLRVERLPGDLALSHGLPAPMEVTIEAGRVKAVDVPLPALGEIAGRLMAPLSADPQPPNEGLPGGPGPSAGAGMPLPVEHGVPFPAEIEMPLVVELLDEGGKGLSHVPVSPGGSFRFRGLTPGRYGLRVMAAGEARLASAFRSATVKEVEVRPGQVTAVELPLPPAARPPRFTFFGEEVLAVP